jgi:hypothetical protein
MGLGLNPVCADPYLSFPVKTKFAVGESTKADRPIG